MCVRIWDEAPSPPCWLFGWANKQIPIKKHAGERTAKRFSVALSLARLVDAYIVTTYVNEHTHTHTGDAHHKHLMDG